MLIHEGWRQKKRQNFYKDIHQTHWEVSEDLESGTQKVDEVHQVSGRATVGLSHVPFIVCQLDEFIYFLVKLGVNLSLCSMTSILRKKKKTFNKLRNAILPKLIEEHTKTQLKLATVLVYGTNNVNLLLKMIVFLCWQWFIWHDT